MLKSITRLRSTVCVLLKDNQDPHLTETKRKLLKTENTT